MLNPMEIFKNFRIPIDYYRSKEKEPPFLVYIGKGSSNFEADDENYYKSYDYSVEYYFNFKNEELEDEIERQFDIFNIIWNKSGDIYIEDEDMFVIYYYI